MVRVGPPLVICEVSFQSSQGAEHSKHEKPLIDSIAKVTYWPHFLLSAYEERHNTRYKGTVDLGFIRIKTVPGLSMRKAKDGRYTQQATDRHSVKSRCSLFHKHLQYVSNHRTTGGIRHSNVECKLCKYSAMPHIVQYRSIYTAHKLTSTFYGKKHGMQIYLKYQHVAKD